MSRSRRLWWPSVTVIAASVAAPLLLAALHVSIDPRMGQYLTWSALQSLVCCAAAICFAYPVRLASAATRSPHPASAYGAGLVCWVVTVTLVWNTAVAHLVSHLAILAMLLGCAVVAMLPASRTIPPEVDGA